MNDYWLKKSDCFDWKKKPTINYKNLKNNKCVWFPDGKLDLYYNFVLRHKTTKESLVTIFDDKLNRYTYGEIDILVDKYLEFIYSKKKKINRILIHASSSIESAIAMLAAVKMGIYFSVLFEDLSIVAIKKRVDLFNPDIIISRPGISKVKNILRSRKIKYLLFKEFWNNKDKFKKKYKSKILDPKRSFFCLFTSGSTGEPKGIIHSYGGYAVYSNYTCKKQFGMNKNSIMFTCSDAGWINGHTYALFGPLGIGSKTILIDKPINILNPEIFKLISKQNPTIFYLPVTLIRLLKSVSYKRQFYIKSLKILGSMGEPLAPNVGNWFSKKFRLINKPIINTYFQTETGGIICSPKHFENVEASPHGCVGKIISNNIQIKKLHKLIKREFVIKSQWPGRMTGVLNGKKVWKKYFDKSNNFRLFDLATISKKNVYIHGRIDDVINIRGHRIGSEELESVLLEIKNIIEVSAISVQDELEGGQFYIFIKSINNKFLDTKVRSKIVDNFGTFALPSRIIYLEDMPKTRSGKILRRLLRNLVENPKNPILGDISTILNKNQIPDILKKINL